MIATEAPKRIRLSRAKGWRKPEGAVVVARPTRWGNPIAIAEPFTREDAVRMYRELVVDGEAWFVTDEGTRWEQRNRLTPAIARRPRAFPTVEDIRRNLAGRDLACWCPLDQPCHADVLLELANTQEAPR